MLRLTLIIKPIGLSSHELVLLHGHLWLSHAHALVRHETSLELLLSKHLLLIEMLLHGLLLHHVLLLHCELHLLHHLSLRVEWIRLETPGLWSLLLCLLSLFLFLLLFEVIEVEWIKLFACFAALLGFHDEIVGDIGQIELRLDLRCPAQEFIKVEGLILGWLLWLFLKRVKVEVVILLRFGLRACLLLLIRDILLFGLILTIARHILCKPAKAMIKP